MSRPHPHVGVPQPRLPFEPLRRYVESRTVKSAWNPTSAGEAGGGMLTGLGWLHSSWQAKAWQKGKAEGALPIMAADRLACALGLHPALIWGDEWWTAQ